MPASDDGRPAKARSSVWSQRASGLARLATLSIVCMAAAWLYVVAPKAGDSDVEILSYVGQELMEGGGYSADTLRQVNEETAGVLHSGWCAARAIEDLTIVRTALVEAAFVENDADAAEKFLVQADEAAHMGLTCNPNSSALWAVLAWNEFIKNDDTPRLHALLDMSYRTGPYDGWALIRRVDMQLRFLPNISDVERARLVDQIDWLILSDLLPLVAARFVEGGEPQKALIKEILSRTDEQDQKKAATMIRQQGGDIELPFVEPLGARPWR
ncbi:hypothetical protein V5F59_17950 [Xanthobacter autotrophicus DSM 431]|uniref:hypothetical protein n=1 Tax=Xanthobacter nonsaccharivorans TaxID=3119912 RepID=UPI00372ACBCE